MVFITQKNAIKQAFIGIRQSKAYQEIKFTDKAVLAERKERERKKNTQKNFESPFSCFKKANEMK